MYFIISVSVLLERNQVQNILNEAIEDKWLILEAIKDKVEVVEKYKKSIKCLPDVDVKLKRENNNLTDEKVRDIHKCCEKWRDLWPTYLKDMRYYTKKAVFCSA